MSTFSTTILKHRPKKDGTFHVFIRVTHRQKKAYLPTDYHVKKTQLNKKQQIIDNFILQACNRIIDRYLESVTRLGSAINDFDIKDLVNHLSQNRTEQIDFIGYSNTYIKKLRTSGKTKTSETYQTTINNIKLFTGLEILPVPYITAKFLEDLEKWMVKKQISYTSINLYMRNIRALYNSCKSFYNNEDIGDIRIPYNPFKKYKIPEAPETANRNLDREVILKIRDRKLTRKLDIQGRDVFMISFYLIGLNTIDIYNCPLPVDGRIVYNRTKTKGRRKDRASMSIKIEPELLPLMEKYKGKDRAFNFSTRYSSPGDFNKYVNRGLNRIGKELELTESLTSYYARHSWASLARNECRISKDDVHMALCHSDPSMKITDIYIAKDWSIVDEANRKVIDFINQENETTEEPGTKPTGLDVQ